MHDVSASPALDGEALAPHGLAWFADRLILDARPPIDPLSLARIQARCSGPVPADLLDLWGQSFGGALDYDLPVCFGQPGAPDEHHAGFSLRELFHPGSDHYRDLWGWIEVQQDVEAEARGQASGGGLVRVDLLPIGGFEYLDRLYVEVAEGPTHGSVHVWMRGLPPSWKLRLHRDRSTRVAPSLRAFFAQLVLEDDPWAPAGEYPSGTDMVAAIDGLRDGGHGGLADRVQQAVRQTIQDWRAALRDGSIVDRPALRRLALDRACATDDVALFEALRAAGCDLTGEHRGGGTVLDLAVLRGAAGVARAARQCGIAERVPGEEAGGRGEG